MNKILCIRFSSIGDIILTSPIIRALKKRYPNAEIHIVTKAQNAQLWAANPYVHHVHDYQGNLWSLANELRKIGFDAIVDLHKNVRSFLLSALLLKIPYQINKFTAERKHWVKIKINTLPQKHIVDRYFDALVKLDIKNDPEGLDFFIPKDQEITPSDYGIEGPYVVYAIGGQHITKVLSYPKMIELCDRLSAKIVLIGDAWDANFGERLSILFPDKVINLCKQTSIGQSASLMKQSEYVISHDSSMMHIAAALKKKIYVIWGSTHKGFGMYPYQTEYVSLEMANLPCRPCSTQGTNVCPLGHFDCMHKISLDPLIDSENE
jgi:heptosyltransferase-2